MEIADLEKKLKEMTENWQRERAGFANYKRRVEGEKAEIRKYAHCDFALQVIRVMEYFESSVTFAKNLPEEAQNVIIGVKYTLDELTRILAANGVLPIEVEQGQSFDTARMQAVARIETDEFAEGTVVEVRRRGWQCYDRVLRSAEVAVAVPSQEGYIPDKGGDDG